MASHSKHAPREGQISPKWLFAVRLFIALALGVGSYLLLVSMRGMAVVGCGPESGCDKVLHSRWAYWFGLPVSLFALMTYITILVTTFWLGRKVAPATQRKAWNVLIGAAALVIGAALWFVFVQVAVIKAICPFCMAAHGSGALASILILVAAPFGPAPEKPWQREKQVFIPATLSRKLLAGAVVGVAVLVSGQVLHQKKTFEVASIPLSTNAPPLLAPTQAVARFDPAKLPQSSVTTASVTQTPGRSNLPAPNYAVPTPDWAKPPPPPQPQPAYAGTTNAVPPNPYPGQYFMVYGTNVLDLKQVPVVGSPYAPRIIVSLYDYTCHHCKLMHAPLMQAQRTFSNELAIISLPMPLDPSCNRTVQRTMAVHTNGCKYARLGLAVWRANRARLSDFDEWMFASTNVPSVDAARQMAGQLVGNDALERSLRDPWIEQQIRQDVDIYDVAVKAGRGSMPQMIIGRKVAVGTMGLKDLFGLISEQFGLTAPAQ